MLKDFSDELNEISEASVGKSMIESRTRLHYFSTTICLVPATFESGTSVQGEFHR